MDNYTCITKQGKWLFSADNDTDAMRLALYYCWRDNEDFVKIQTANYAIGICIIDMNYLVQTV